MKGDIMRKINILYVPVVDDIKLMEIDDDILQKQTLVGGKLQYCRMAIGDTMHLVIDQDAKDKNFELNIRATCILNNFSKTKSQFVSNLLVFGNAFIEGNCLDEIEKAYSPCSVPLDELENLIDICNKADIWWHSVGKKILNNSYFKWFIKPISDDEDF